MQKLIQICTGSNKHNGTEHVLELVATNKMQKMQLAFLMVERVQSTKIKHSVAYFCARNHEFPFPRSETLGPAMPGY